MVNLRKIKVVMSDLKGEKLKSKNNSCTKCAKRVMANSVQCAKCSNMGVWKMHKNEESVFNSSKRSCL